MLDSNAADDKIIGVLDGDAVFAAAHDVAKLPASISEQLVHYFSTYKRIRLPDAPVSVGAVYGREHAEAVVSAAMADYSAKFGANETT
jgi:inorganic pyrophosphatase